MNVVRFPVVPKQRPADEPLTVMATALAHMEQLVSIYREVGARPNPGTILMMIASILDEPELRKAANLAAGFDAPPAGSQDEPGQDDTNCAEVAQARRPVAAACDDPHDNTEAEKAG
ncbi:MAG TPA: hypothetical protein VJL90_02570 [Pseudorhodoplanes sp.]|nr:hypothetical protein [Pseudorhodoplanes sp.]